MLTHANKGTYLVKNRQKRANVIKVWPLYSSVIQVRMDQELVVKIRCPMRF